MHSCFYKNFCTADKIYVELPSNMEFPLLCYSAITLKNQGKYDQYDAYKIT
jgi:hypothetical protein